MGYNNEIPSYASLLEFQEVYLRAIALAWSDENFHKAFFDNPQEALEMWFSYICPWAITISVDKNNSKWDKDAKQWRELPVNKIFIGMPQKPAEINEQAIALAAYNNSGPTYLFTCC